MSHEEEQKEFSHKKAQKAQKGSGQASETIADENRSRQASGTIAAGVKDDDRGRRT
jgi:hypothetical protein